MSAKTCPINNQGNAALERLQARQPHHLAERASFHHLDVECPDSIRAFQTECVEAEGQLAGRVDVLINNAGVCLEGTDKTAVRDTLAVNFFGALGVMEACLPSMMMVCPDPAAAGASGDGGGRRGATATVVWISSGDGELCYLGSKWQRLLSEASTFEVGSRAAVLLWHVRYSHECLTVLFQGPIFTERET